MKSGKIPGVLTNGTRETRRHHPTKCESRRFAHPPSELSPKIESTISRARESALNLRWGERADDFSPRIHSVRTTSCTLSFCRSSYPGSLYQRPD